MNSKSAMPDPFAALRPRLFGIAYRMLGMRADAEDVLQDAWLRWQGTDRAQLQSAEAWLVTVVTRLSIDRLRSAKTEREHYGGWWLPEPLVEAADERTPESVALRRAASGNPTHRELIISFGGAGYVALFEIVDSSMERILAIRHQREDDYH